jgi:hypothetical protein
MAAIVMLALGAPAFAQAPPAPPAPPAPKVTISGLVDFVSTYYDNWRDTNITNDDDDGWYSRERGVFTITGEIGKSKGVVAFELDFTNGVGTNFSGTSSNFDLDTDVPGFFETKWLYVETPVTGPGSLLPFIPVPSIIRAGAQPARGHAYKNGILFSGDFPGVTLETMWAPNLRSTVTFAQMREQVDELTGFTESWALLTSVEWDVFKGLTVKPTYVYASLDGGTGGSIVAGATFLGSPGAGGFDPNQLGLQSHRHYIGGDVRWTSGPFSFQPTFLWLVGEQQCIAGVDTCFVTKDVDINAWILDVVGGFRTGPLNLEARFMWTPGQGATQAIQNGSDQGYYQPINPAFGYMSGWTEIQTSGVDYATALLGGLPGVSLRTSPSYDKYGRIFVGVAADYSVTPALTLHGVANASWTDEKVDTSTGTATSAFSGITPVSSGDDRYLGTEVNLGFTYRFAPNVAFDLMGAYMWTGDAMGVNGNDPENVKKVASRVRVTW